MKHLPKIEIKVINHKDQRYDTSGDYFNQKGSIQFRLSRMGEDTEFLILLHELVEWYLIHKKGIKIRDIDDFDKWYLKVAPEKEPGDDPRAPYYKEHQIATLFEKEMVRILGVDWKTYDESFNKLEYGEANKSIKARFGKFLARKSTPRTPKQKR